MSTAQYLLNAGLLVLVLGTNLGTRPVTRGRLLAPLAAVAVAAVLFAGPVPPAGGDRDLVVLGAVVGVLLGALAGALVRVGHDADGTVTATAGWPYAALWCLVVAGRVVFAYGAQNWFPAWVADVSRSAGITGAAAWTSAFVLMALAMVTVRVLVTAVLAHRTSPYSLAA